MTHERSQRLCSQAQKFRQALLAASLLCMILLSLRELTSSEVARRQLEVGLGLDVPAAITKRDFRIHFVSFADCSSAARFDVIKRQAVHSGLFDEVHVFSLSTLDPAFLGRNRGFVPGPDDLKVGADGTPLVRGCGYWLWKPQSVLQALAAADPGDVIVYADAGCSIVHGNWRRFWNYVEMVREAAEPRVIGFELAPLERRRERQWTKGDLLAHFNVSRSPSVLDSPQLHSTFFYLAKSDATVAMVEAWVRLGEEGAHRFLDDSPSRDAPDAEDFMENRHDQSIFSLLRKTRGAIILPDDSRNPAAAIQASRCRYGHEASCWYTPPKQALWVWATQHVAGLGRQYGGGIPSALPRRGDRPGSRPRSVVLPLAEDA